MDRPRSIFRKPTFVALAITFLLLVLYASLQDQQGNAVHIFRNDRNIYVSMEAFGSLVKYEVFSEDFASLPGTYELSYEKKDHVFTLKGEDVPQKSLKISKKKDLYFPGSVVSSALNSDILYVVDELTGIYQVQVDDSEKPDEPAVSFFGAQDILVEEGIAYIAGGEAGGFIYASEPPSNTLVLKSSLNTDGTAQALDLLTHRSQVPAPSEDRARGGVKNEEIVEVVTRTLYVADGENGVVIMDASQPISPTRTVTISREGFVHHVLYREDHLYVSQGEQGWSIVNVKDPKLYREVISRDPKGEVRDISVNDRYIAVAAGKYGLLVYLNSSDLSKISQEPAAVVPASDFVSSVELVKNYAILADGVEGVRVVDLANLVSPVVRASEATPGEYGFRQIWAHRSEPEDSSEREKYARSILDLRNEVFMLAAGMLLLPLFFSLTTLPSTNLWYWLLRVRGQPVTVDGGQIVSPPQQQHATLMRAIHVDTASAVAVLGPRGTRWLGPGLGFLQRRERIGRTLDLRPAMLISGPLYHEDPFSEQVAGEDEAQCNQRMLRRQETSAETRDGVEIVPNFLLDVRVNSGLDDARRGYGYNETNAQLAMLPDLEGYEQTLPNMTPANNWYALVTQLARQLWLEYLARYTLEELFTPLPDLQNTFPGTVRTGLQRVAWMMQCHLTQNELPRLDENGWPTGERMQSAQFQALRLRGLRLSRLQVINLRLSPDARQRLEQDWLATWPARARQEQEQAEAQQAQRGERARKTARRDFRDFVTRPEQNLANQPGRQGAPLNELELLISRVQGTLNLPELSLEMRQRFNDLLAGLQGWDNGP